MDDFVCMVMFFDGLDRMVALCLNSICECNLKIKKKNYKLVMQTHKTTMYVQTTWSFGLCIVILGIIL